MMSRNSVVFLLIYDLKRVSSPPATACWSDWLFENFMSCSVSDVISGM